MKINKKIKLKKTFILLASPFFLAVFFIFSIETKAGENAKIEKGDVVISELMWAGSSISIADEFVELLNTTNHSIDIGGFKLSRISNDAEVLMLTVPEGKSISAGGYFIISNYSENNSVVNIKPDIINTAVSLANDKLQISLYSGSIEDKNSLIDIAGDGKDPFEGEKDGVKKSMERNNIIADGKLKSSWHTCAVAENIDAGLDNCATPGAKNSEVEEEKEEIFKPKIYPTGISITELFPNPFQSQYEEYIELYNGTSEDVDFKDWMLRDASKTGKYIFGESVILKSKKYLAIFKEKFKFALNNSGDESVTLLNPNGKEVSKVEYDGSKKDISLNFDGLRWRGSKFLTPGAENILNNEPYGKVKLDKDVFENAYADFSVSTGDKDGEKVKVTWDFGDKHKSYLAKTRHKYEKIGKYAGSVKLSDGNEDVIKNFEIEVKKFPHPKVRIVAISANPAGADTGVEFITVQNKDKKKINLNGWSIAAGWKDNLINHLIREDVIIKGKKEKQITSEVSSFTLNNVKAKIQLRYPDGKVVHEVKYESPSKSIAEGFLYVKVKGGWTWQNELQLTTDNKQDANNIQDDVNAENTEENVVEQKMPVEEVLGIEIAKRENRIIPLEVDFVKIELLKNQLQSNDAKNLYEIDGQYFFTPQSQPQEHYLISFAKNIFSDLNSGLNNLLNYFL